MLMLHIHFQTSSTEDQYSFFRWEPKISVYFLKKCFCKKL